MQPSTLESNPPAETRPCKRCGEPARPRNGKRGVVPSLCARCSRPFGERGVWKQERRGRTAPQPPGLAERMRARRAALDMTAEDLACACGLSASAVRYYETGHNTPSVDTLRTLARVLRTTLDWLVEGTGPEERAE